MNKDTPTSRSDNPVEHTSRGGVEFDVITPPKENKENLQNPPERGGGWDWD